MIRRAVTVSWFFALALLTGATALWAEDTASTTPAFSLASSHIFTTKEHPALLLTHRQVDHLDFRVYRVNDVFAFFEKLRDPHELGSEEPLVPQEQTWLERIAFWKAARRASLRAFVRREFSPAYREARAERQDAEKIVQRRVLNANTFAQAPLLNSTQLVTSWREMLPPVREAEVRRVPLEVTGSGVYVVEAVNPPLRAYTVVVISDLGLVVKSSAGELLLYAADRFNGNPAGSCGIKVLADQQTVATGSTADDGTFSALVDLKESDHLVALARCGDRVAATDPGVFSVKENPRELVGYVYTDRPVYRPGHTVHFRSVLRWREAGELSAFDRKTVEATVTDSSDKVLLRQNLPVNEYGSVSGSLTLPPTATLGYYSVRIAAGEKTATGSFEVQEYRKPEFDVAVRFGSRFVLQGGRVAATISARYYFGQPVAGASVRYVLRHEPYYSPQRSGEGDDEEQESIGGDGEAVFDGTARLNDQGTAEISLPLDIDEHGNDYAARLEAAVTDASSREVSGTSALVATYGRFMLDVEAERYVYAPRSTATARLRAVGYDGEPQPNVNVTLNLERVEYRNGYGQVPTITAVQRGTVQTDASGRGSWSVTLPDTPGNYRIRTSAPSEGRAVSESASLWVPGRQERVEEDEEQILELIADRRTYAPGDIAHVVIRGADFDSPVLVTKENQHLSYRHVVRTRNNEAIELPVDEQDIGDTYVSVAFLKDDRLYRAERRLNVPATSRQIQLTATPEQPVTRPGESGVFAIHAADAAGNPVRAELSVGIVDEAVYGVRPDTTPDPLRFFYRREYNMVSTSFSRDYPFVGYSGADTLQLTHRRRPFTLADFKADRPERPRVRKDFPDTAFWTASLITDASGNARVTLDYPDSLTTWRLTARAVTASTEVGATTAHALTTKDVIVRVVAPRFLTEGDEAAVPTIVHNYLPEARNVSLSFTADGLTRMDGNESDTRSFDVPSNGQQRSDWRYKADRIGTVTMNGTAKTDVASDAVRLTLPVLPAGLQRTLSASGSIVGGGERQAELTVPDTANVSAREIRVSLAPSLAGTLLGALDFLTSYPYGCTEQTLSSFLPNLSVLRTLASMKMAPAERLQALDRQVSDGLTRLYDFQHDDGGWGWWKTDENQPFMTAYALEGLLRAKQEGVSVESWRVDQGARALVALYAKYPRALPDLKAYMVYVLAGADAGRESGADELTFGFGAAIDALWSARSRMSATGQALLLMTLDLRKDARAAGLSGELIASAQTRGDLSWWSDDRDRLLDDEGESSVQASALALKALVRHDAQNPIFERVVRWLVLNRTAGYWINTEQTAMALDGLLAYMRARGEKPAPVTAEIFLNSASIGSRSFDAESLTAPDPVVVSAPAVSGQNVIRVVTKGEGTLYYSAAARYYDKPAASERTGTRHLALARSYSTLTSTQQNGRIVYKEGSFSGSARPGDLLLVHLTVAGSSDWRYLMVEDPLPAGAEPVERDDAYQIVGRRSLWSGSNRELRDDRVVFFQESLARGRQEFTYLLRVTTPGTFAAMPARVAPMYVPDVFASSETQIVTVSPEGVQ